MQEEIICVQKITYIIVVIIKSWGLLPPQTSTFSWRGSAPPGFLGKIMPHVSSSIMANYTPHHRLGTAIIRHETFKINYSNAIIFFQKIQGGGGCCPPGFPKDYLIAVFDFESPMSYDGSS